MRIFSYLFVAIILTGCVSGKKLKNVSRSFQEIIAVQNDNNLRQQDSISSLMLALERARGGNDALLITQDKLQDRLAIQEDELDELKGNLSSTSSRLSSELSRLKAEKAAAEAAYDTLLLRQGNVVATFQKSIEAAADIIYKAIDGKLPDENYAIRVNAGDLTLSVQEDLIFTPKAVDKLTEESATICRAVMDALQQDPLLKLLVIGHTDNQPNPRRGTSNREYAALRATNLATELTQTYYLSPNRVAAASYGEFAPLQSNATPEGQRANRRIDFVLRNNVGNLLRELEKLKE